MAAKLLALKVVVYKKKSVARPQPYLNRSAHVPVEPGLNHYQSLKDGNLVAL